jgi:RNA polymerase sigma factor, sigma-70 family
MIEDLSLATEQELLEQCLRNNRTAQKVIYERLSPRMFSVCIRYIGERERAKDVLHDGFITLFSKIGTYKNEGSFEGWARRIFVNTALMQIRKADVLKHSDDLDKLHTDMPIETHIGEKIDNAKLFSLIAKMPVGFRTVFNLYVIEGFTHAEIAKELNITEGGSRSQLSRAKEWLKVRIKQYE